MGQGDNQFLEVSFPVPDDAPPGHEWNSTYRTVLERKVKAFLTGLATVTDAVDLPLKPEEAWVSSALKVYGKRWVLSGVILPQQFKRGCRTSGDIDVLVSEAFESFSVAAATGLSTAMASTLICYIHSPLQSLHLLKYFVNVNFSSWLKTLLHMCL